MWLNHKSRARLARLASEQLEAFAQLLPKAIDSSDPEDVHKLRVASRRLQQYLDLLFAAPRDEALAGARKSLRRARRASSAIRNCDVVQIEVARLPALLRRGTAEWWEMFFRYLAEERAGQARRAARKLHGHSRSGKPWHGHLRRLGKLLEQEARDHSAAAGRTADQAADAQRLEQHLGARLAESWSEFAKRLDAARQAGQPAALHRLRIAAKRLRYQLEILRHLRVPGAGQAVRALTRLQDHLGSLHDLVVIEDMLIAAARPEILKAHIDFGAVLTRLLVATRRLQQRREAQCWQLLESPPFRQTLQQAELWIQSKTPARTA